MRVLTIQTIAMSVTLQHEADWPGLAAAAVRAVEEGREAVPTVWFRTDDGAVGLIPISERAPVTFSDDAGAALLIGTVVAFGHDAAPST